MKRALSIAFLLLPLHAASAQQKRPIVPEDLYRLRTASDVTVSPDGKWVVYVQTSIDSAGNRYVRDLYAVTADGTTKRRLTFTPQSNEGSPAFSPDGNSLAFVARREGDERAAEIYVLPFNAPGEARRVTTIARGTAQPVWSPDGTRIAFAVADSTQADTTKSKTPLDRHNRLAANAKKNDPRVLNRLDFVAEQSFREDRWGQIYVVDASGEGAVAKRITAGDYPHNGATWSADGRTLVFSAEPPRGNYHPDFEEDADLFSVSADGGAPQNLTHTTDYSEFAAQYSPDGKWLAFMRRKLGDFETAVNGELVIAGADGSDPTCITCALDRGVNSFAWDKLGRMYFTVGDRGGVQLYRAASKDWKPQPLLTGARGVLTFDVAGNTIAWSQMKPELPSDVYAADIDGKKEHRLTTLNDSLLATVFVQPYEEVWYTAPDGAKLQGWIVKPPRGANKSTPLAVEMHGGPHVMWGPGEASMWLEYEALAGDGYTVFFANPRGSDGYGFEFKKAIHRNWGELPMSDVLTGVDTVLARGLADPNKQYLTGGSYAGFLTAWMVGHTDRFKAAVAQRGVYDMVSWWGMANTWRLYESEFSSRPWEDPDLAWKASPVAYAANIHTPLLLLHGEQDYRVGLGGVQTLYRMLKEQGRDVQLVLYPREGHEVTRSGEPSHRVDHMSRILDWFDTHTANASTR